MGIRTFLCLHLIVHCHPVPHPSEARKAGKSAVECLRALVIAQHVVSKRELGTRALDAVDTTVAASRTRAGIEVGRTHGAIESDVAPGRQRRETVCYGHGSNVNRQVPRYDALHSPSNIRP